MATAERKKEKGVLEDDILKSVRDALETVKVIGDHDAIKHDYNSKGISLLEVKNRIMLQYMQDLTLIMMKKVTGDSIKDHPAIWRMIESRTFMEKIMTIEQKIKYEINKLVKRYRFGETGESDGLKFKPNIANFNVESDDEDEEEQEEEDEKDDSEKEEEEEEEKKKQGKGVYRPPKVAPMPYTADETVEEKEKRVKKRALSNALLSDLRAELLDEPEEIVESADLHRIRADRQRREREEYEEKFFVRTSVSKQEKNKRRQMATMSSLEGLVKFDDYYGDEPSTDGQPAKKRKTSRGFKGKGKAKKGKGKKKWHH